MGSRSASLSIVRASTRAVCAWCIYRGSTLMRRWDVCLVDTDGRHPQAGRSTWLWAYVSANTLRTETMNPRGRCPYYTPTRLSRLIPWRR